MSLRFFLCRKQQILRQKFGGFNEKAYIGGKNSQKTAKIFHKTWFSNVNTICGRVEVFRQGEDGKCSAPTGLYNLGYGLAPIDEMPHPIHHPRRGYIVMSPLQGHR